MLPLIAGLILLPGYAEKKAVTVDSVKARGKLLAGVKYDSPPFGCAKLAIVTSIGLKRKKLNPVSLLTISEKTGAWLTQFDIQAFSNLGDNRIGLWADAGSDPSWFSW